MLHGMSTPQSSRAVPGYLGAVAAATLVYAVQRNMVALLMDSLSPLQTDHLLMLSAAVLIIAVVIGVVTLGPWLLAVELAERLNIRNPWYFALWGAAVGLALGPPLFALWPGSVLDGEAVPPWYYADRLALDFLEVGPVFALSRAVGGVTTWWINGRHTAASA